MSTTTIKPNQPVIGLPDTYYLIIPKFSISPLHAQALSNIYAPIAADLFIPHDPKWTTSSSPPATCVEYGKRHYRRTHVSRYRSSREVNMGRYYGTDPRGLLPDERLRSSGLEELWIHQSPSLYPQFGDLVLDGEVKRAKVNKDTASSSSSSSQPVQRKPILEGGLVQEIGLIFYNTKVMKDEFPVPFCDLPDHRFVEWVVRNMGLLGVGAWEAECEAMDVLWRTKEKKREEMMERERAIEDEIAEEDEQRAAENGYEDTHEIAEMRLRLDVIQMRKVEKRKKKNKKRNVLWMWRNMKKNHEEVISGIKACFCSK